MCNICNKCCCIQNESSNQDLYVEIRNRSKISVSVVLSYTIRGNITTKQSPIYHYGQIMKLTFPQNATQVDFNVLNHSMRGTPIIANISLRRIEITCFSVFGIPTDAVVIEVPC